MISKSEPKPKPVCNCRGGISTCPVGGRCQETGVVYQATVVRSDNDHKETYTGLSARRFKDRLYEHRADMKDSRRNGTSLSNYVWTLKHSNPPYSLNWKILARCPPFNPTTRTCRLCLMEKYLIMFRQEGASLNDRSEIFATCRHRLKPLLGNS